MNEQQKNPRSGNSDSIDNFLCELIQSIKAKEVVVFCGAGISRHSGLPIVNELIPYILEKLGVTPDETQTIMNANLPFEVFMETLRSNSDVGKIFDIFNLGEPNTNHILLAKLAKAGYITTICTTNFDRLIEKAFDREGLARGKDYQVYYKEVDLEHIPWNNHPIHLIKIHGSVEDKENIAITLKQVASQLLSNQRQKVIEYIFSTGRHQQVLILGYSCSDVFDLSPQIEAIRENHKRVLLIDHPRKNEKADKQKKNPFHYFEKNRWIVFDTDELVKAIWNSCIAEKIPSQSEIDKTAWQKYVEAWSSETEEKDSKQSKYGIAGRIFDQISEFEHTIKYYEQALNIAKQRGDKQGEGGWLGNLGLPYSKLGEYRKAIDYYEQALHIAREIGDKLLEGGNFVNIGLAYRDLGEYWKAISYYEQALSMAKEIGHKQNEGICLGNLGDVYFKLSEYQKAMDHYGQALRIARVIGDKEGEGTWSDSLGNTYYVLGQYRKAISYYEQALTIAKEIGNKQQEGICLGNLGHASDTLGEYQKAIDYLEQALRIAREIGYKQGEGIRLGNLGDVYFSLGEYRKAMDNYEQALRIARQIGYKEGEGSWLASLGNIYDRLGEYRKAIDYYEQALRIARQISDKRVEGLCFSSLGIAYHHLGEYQKAINYYEQALDILRPMLCDDHSHVRLITENLSKAKSLWKR